MTGPTTGSDLSIHRGGGMSNNSGAILYLRKMAERCRRAAEESRSGEEAQYLVELAESCEERLAERERAETILATEED
jgi:hypothetical protein